MEQEQPRRLDIWDVGDAIKQDLVLCSGSSKIGCNESRVPDPLFMGRQLKYSPHVCPRIDSASHALQSIACLWTRTTFVPNLGLSTDVGVEERHLGQNMLGGAINVIRVCVKVSPAED